MAGHIMCQCPSWHLLGRQLSWSMKFFKKGTQPLIMSVSGCVATAASSGRLCVIQELLSLWPCSNVQPHIRKIFNIDNAKKKKQWFISFIPLQTVWTPNISCFVSSTSFDLLIYIYFCISGCNTFHKKLDMWSFNHFVMFIFLLMTLRKLFRHRKYQAMKCLKCYFLLFLL